MELAAIQTGVLKMRTHHAAYGKRTVTEYRTGTMGIVRHTVGGHMVEIGVFKKIRRKTAFCRPVKKPLVDDFQRPVWVGIIHAVLVLPATGFGVWVSDAALLFLKGKDILLHALDFTGVVATAFLFQLGQQFISSGAGASLQNIVDRPHGLCPVAGRIINRIGHFQIVGDALGDLAGAPHRLIVFDKRPSFVVVNGSAVIRPKSGRITALFDIIAPSFRDL